MNKVLLAHQRIASEYGISSILLFPMRIVPKIQENGRRWGVVKDCKFIGVISSEAMVRFINKAVKSGCRLSGIYIHHLSGIVLEEMEKILDCCDVPVQFYIHDYFTICDSFNLLKNGLEYCGSAKVCEEKCFKCRYYGGAEDRHRQIEDIINRYRDRLEIVVPSNDCKKLWGNAYPDFLSYIRVVEHQVMLGEYISGKTIENRGINLAYLGYAGVHKGWTQWEKTVTKLHRMRKGYDYYYLGTSEIHLPFVKKVPVDFRKHANAMIHALRDKSIDIVVLWSICPETYSYTYFEALASDAFIITNKDSGNIADQVRRRNNGIVLDTEEDLLSFLSNEQKVRQSLDQYYHSDREIPYELVDNGEWLKEEACDSGFDVAVQVYIPIICRLLHLIYDLKYAIKHLLSEPYKRKHG